jgi:hypothetical protein
MSFKNIKKFCAAYKRLEADGGRYSWFGLDQALSHLCRTVPRHVSVNEVYAKIRIINRAYLANLQFGAKEAEWKVAQKFVMRDADVIMAPLRRSSKFSRDSLATLLNAHEQLVKLAFQVTKRKENSFVSKYLHFHFPDTVPIFDSKAYSAAWKLAKAPPEEFAQYDKRLNYDYAYYCGSLFQIIDALQACGVKSPRLKFVDVLLYGSRG